ncbi:MAG: hypothetical protein ABSC64_15465 [Candidatus Korobacteraceae bacterium]|jgi:hypothetical protein
MPNPKRNPNAYDQVLAKYERANEHIKELDSRLTEFGNFDPHKIRREVDPKTGDVSFYAIEVPRIPFDFSTIAGDAIHNLRTTLDHIACRMIEAAGNEPTSISCFPICDTANKYRTEAPAKVKGMRKLAIQRLDRLHPYKGGNNLLWQLHRLDIIDKHKLLLTLGFASLANTMTPSQRAKAAAQGAITSGTPNPQGLGVFVNFEFPKEPLQAGSKLLTLPASEANEDVKFLIGVAIHEPGVVENAPLHLFLEFIRNEVYSVILDLAPYV